MSSAFHFRTDLVSRSGGESGADRASALASRPGPPFPLDASERFARDRASVAERHRLEVERGQLALATASPLAVLEPVDAHRRDGLVRVKEQAEPNLLDQPRSGAHRPERPSALRDRRVRAVDPGLRSGALDDGRGASEVIGVRVREDEMPQILRMAAQRSQRVKNRGLVTGVPGIDEGEPAVVALEEHAVGTAERHQSRPVDDLLHTAHLLLARPLDP